MKSKHLAIFLLCVVGFPISAKAQCSPFQGLGAAQFFDNSGVPLTNGVLYSFQAGTSTQQATFTDSTCTVQNVNPITFTTGARVNIWLTTGNFYKFQLCLQNDGSTCAPSDVLFSVDQVPGGASGGGSGGSSPFISSSPNPATTGILRCASGDACLAFRNAANSANLTLTKDTNDILTWSAGSFKLPEVSTPACSTGFDVLWADSTNHTFRACANGGSPTTVARGGIDITGPGADHVTGLTFGSTDLTLSGTAPTTNQYLLWNGTNVVGVNQLEVVVGGIGTVSGNTAPCVASAPSIFCRFFLAVLPHTLTRLLVNVAVAQAGCGPNAAWGIKDQTANSVLASLSPTSIGITDSGALSVAMPAGHQYSVGVITQSAGCTTNGTADVVINYQ